jgi:peptidyl-prolyl cis-trans isomerase C
MPIKVNNVEITDDDVFREMQYQTDAPNVETVIFNAAQALVVQQLLLQEAKIDNSDKEQEAKINQLLENNLRVPTADETACKRYYENNNKKFFDNISDFYIVNFDWHN